jgi:hypothetical protein
MQQLSRGAALIACADHVAATETGFDEASASLFCICKYSNQRPCTMRNCIDKFQSLHHV